MSTSFLVALAKAIRHDPHSGKFTSGAGSSGTPLTAADTKGTAAGLGAGWTAGADAKHASSPEGVAHTATKHALKMTEMGNKEAAYHGHNKAAELHRRAAVYLNTFGKEHGIAGWKAKALNHTAQSARHSAEAVTDLGGEFQKAVRHDPHSGKFMGSDGAGSPAGAAGGKGLSAHEHAKGMFLSNPAPHNPQNPNGSQPGDAGPRRYAARTVLMPDNRQLFIPNHMTAEAAELKGRFKGGILHAGIDASVVAQKASDEADALEADHDGSRKSRSALVHAHRAARFHHETAAALTHLPQDSRTAHVKAASRHSLALSGLYGGVRKGDAPTDDTLDHDRFRLAMAGTIQKDIRHDPHSGKFMSGSGGGSVHPLAAKASEAAHAASAALPAGEKTGAGGPGYPAYEAARLHMKAARLHAAWGDHAQALGHLDKAGEADSPAPTRTPAQAHAAIASLHAHHVSELVAGGEASHGEAYEAHKAALNALHAPGADQHMPFAENTHQRAMEKHKSATGGAPNAGGPPAAAQAGGGSRWAGVGESVHPSSEAAKGKASKNAHAATEKAAMFHEYGLGESDFGVKMHERAIKLHQRAADAHVKAIGETSGDAQKEHLKLAHEHTEAATGLHHAMITGHYTPEAKAAAAASKAANRVASTNLSHDGAPERLTVSPKKAAELHEAAAAAVSAHVENLKRQLGGDHMLTLDNDNLAETHKENAAYFRSMHHGK